MDKVKEIYRKVMSILDKYVFRYIYKFLKYVLPDGIMSNPDSVLVFKRLLLFGISLFVAQALFIIIIVFIVVKTGGESFVLPNVEGRELVEAFNILDKEDVNLSIRAHYFSNYPLGTVVSQEPKAGVKIKRGRTVYLVLNLQEQATIKMPNVVGLNYEEAMNIINRDVVSKKSTVNILPKVELTDDSYENDIVISQIPPAGEVVGSNTEIILTVNKK